MAAGYEGFFRADSFSEHLRRQAGLSGVKAALLREVLDRRTLTDVDGLARAINPVHTQMDGDTLFALATGAAGRTPDLVVLATMAAEAVARATVRAALAARSTTTAEGLHLPEYAG